MSLEYTIDIQLTELGFPHILQTSETPVRETLPGRDPQTQVPTKPTTRQLENDPSVTSDKCSSQQTTDTSGSPPAPRQHDTSGSPPAPRQHHTSGSPPAPRQHDTSGSPPAPRQHHTEIAFTYYVLPSPAADGPLVTSGAQTTEHLANRGQANEKSHKGGQKAKEKREDGPESTDDSEVSENDDEESLDEDQDGVDDESDGTGDYHCGVCDLQLRSSMKLQDHMNLHTGQRPHCCAECGKRFCQLNNYRAHLKTHAQAKPVPLRCRICRKDFRSKKTLKVHLTKTHFEKEFYECDFCKRVFTDRKECEQHIEWHKGNQGQFVCDKCDHRFYNQRLLKRHQSRKCQRSFICTDCLRTFSRKNALLKHSFSHIGLLPYTCLRCRCHFRLARLYRQHKCEPQRIHCVACLRVFPSQEDFQKHKKDTGCWGHRESKGDEIRCPECGESFTTKEELKNHGSAHRRILTCDECGKGFRSALLLMSHMGGHAVQTPCLCQSCGRGFLHQQDYDSHLGRCGLAPLPPKRAQKSSAPPGKPTPLPVTDLPIARTASTRSSGSDPTSRVSPISNSVFNVPAPSPENPAEGSSWRITLDKPPPQGLNLVLFVPVTSPLAAGLLPTVQQTRPPAQAVRTLPPAPAILDAAVELHKSTLCAKTSSVVGSPLEVATPLDLVANKTHTRGYVAPLDLSNKLTPLVPAVSIKTPELSNKIEALTASVSIKAPAVSIKTPELSNKIEALTASVSIKAPAVSIKAPAVSIKAPAVSIKAPAVSIKAPAVSIKAEFKECRVILRKLSGKAHGTTGDTCSCVHRKTEIRENVGNSAHNNNSNILATVKPEPVGMAPLVMDIKEEPKSPTSVFDQLQS